MASWCFQTGGLSGQYEFFKSEKRRCCVGAALDILLESVAYSQVPCKTLGSTQAATMSAYAHGICAISALQLAR